MKIKIAVFGFKDTLVGQVIRMMETETSYSVDYFISVKPLPDVDVEEEHKKRPNKKTEFVKNGTIFGKRIYYDVDYIEQLRKSKITKVLLLEDDKYLREEIFEKLIAENIEIITYIHPTVYLGGDNEIGRGVIIFPNCYIGYKSDIGDSTIIQSNSIIEHHSVVGRYVEINPRLTTASFVYIKDFVEVNLSVDIINRIVIERGARIGAGSLVMRNCEAGTLYYGRPARKVRRI